MNARPELLLGLAALIALTTAAIVDPQPPGAHLRLAEAGKRARRGTPDAAARGLWGPLPGPLPPGGGKIGLANPTGLSRRPRLASRALTPSDGVGCCRRTIEEEEPPCPRRLSSR